MNKNRKMLAHIIVAFVLLVACTLCRWRARCGFCR